MIISSVTTALALTFGVFTAYALARVDFRGKFFVTGLILAASMFPGVALVTPLSDADTSVQSMPDASPAKWHLAHTTWFFETFVLRDHVAGYRLHDQRFPFLFNSYYEAEGKRHARERRGMITRPSLEEVLAYRAAVDAAVLDALDAMPQAARDLVAGGRPTLSAIRPAAGLEPAAKAVERLRRN